MEKPGANHPAELTSEGAPICRLLSWDTDHFGFRIATVTDDRLGPDSMDAILSWCVEQQVKCLYFAAMPTCSDSLTLAHRTGFKFVDFRLVLARECATTGAWVACADGTRLAVASELPVLERLAGTAHFDTRFFKDTNFEPERASALYARWVQRAVAGARLWVMAAQDDPGSPCGYISLEGDGSDNSLRIGLLAVADAHRGMGAGRALVNRVLEEVPSHGGSSIRVATQGSNIGAQRLYQSLGFRTIRAHAWFHRWF